MECTICLQRLFYKDKKTLGCKHGFHKACIKNVYEQAQGVARCPLCRHPFTMRIKPVHVEPVDPPSQLIQPTIPEQPPQLPASTTVHATENPIQIHVHTDLQPSIYPFVITQPSSQKTQATTVSNHGIHIHLIVGTTNIQIKIE